MGKQQRQRVGALSLHVQKMHVDARQRHGKLRQRVQARLGSPPIKLFPPIRHKIHEPGDFGPVGPSRSRRLIGKPGAGETGAKILDLRLRHGKSEWLRRFCHAFPLQDHDGHQILAWRYDSAHRSRPATDCAAADRQGQPETAHRRRTRARAPEATWISGRDARYRVAGQWLGLIRGTRVPAFLRQEPEDQCGIEPARLPEVALDVGEGEVSAGLAGIDDHAGTGQGFLDHFQPHPFLRHLR